MEAKLHVVLSAWKNFDLGGTQKMLDEIAAEISEKQDQTDTSRKKLVEQLKEFRNTVSDKTKTETSGVIKSFQNEVDFLNKKSKFAEAAFLKCYQKYLDIVDPVSMLEYCKNIQKKANKVCDLEIENKNLQDILNDYNDEFKDVKNQELTIKNLKEKIKKIESEMDISIAYNIKEIEKRFLNELHGEKQIIIDEKEDAMKQFIDMEKQKKSLEHNFEQLQSEFFDIRSKLDDGSAGRTEEIELLANDLDRSNQVNSLLQKEIENLKCQLVQCTNLKSNLSSEQSEVSYLENELRIKDNEIGQLMAELKKTNLEYSASGEKSRQTIQLLEAKLQVSKNGMSELESIVRGQQDYEEIKRELNVIKFVEFGSQNGNATFYKTTNSKPLELLLLEKNKVLQTENTAYKLTVSSLNDQLSQAELANKDLSQSNTLQHALNKQLEMDVLCLNTAGVSNLEETKSQAVLLSEAIQSPGGERFPDSSHSYADSFSMKGVNAESILPIIFAQRERFKIRNTELEGELFDKNNQILSLQGEAEVLHTDNIKLYEKIRYLRSFDQRGISLETNTESRYSNQYESGLDPFSTFSLRERQRKYQALSPFEKITLFLGKFFIQSKTARTAAFIYCMFIHCLVFFALFLMAQTESCKRDVSTRCSEMFKTHMYDVHGNADFVLKE